MVPTIIRDGSVGTAHNCYQIDIGCQRLQAWDHLVRRARYAQLIRRDKNDGNSSLVPTLIRDGGVGSAHNSCQIDIGCRRLQAWDHLPRRARYAQLIRRDKNDGNSSLVSNPKDICTSTSVVHQRQLLI